MKRSILFVMVLAFATAIFYAGCAGGMGGVGYGLSPKKLGKERVVEKSGPRPKWAFENTMFVKNGVVYASGYFSDAPNLSKGLEVATKLAQAKLAESIQMRLKDDFTYASEGLSIESSMLERILNTTTEEMLIRGFFQNKLHYEKKQVMTLQGTGYKYDCFALVEITAANYQAAVDNAIGRNLKGPVSEEFRNKVDERQRDFFRLGEKETPSAPLASADAGPLPDKPAHFERKLPGKKAASGDDGQTMVPEPIEVDDAGDDAGIIEYTEKRAK